MHILNWADYTILGIILISILISLIRGFVREVLSVITWIAAFFVAFKFCEAAAAIFSSYISNPSIRLALGFALIFLIVLILGDLLSFLISKLASKSGMGIVDRSFGMVFGCIRGVLLVAVILLLASLGSSSKDAWWQNSYLIPHFQGLVHWLQGFLPAKLSAVSHSVTHAMSSVGHKAAAQTINVIPKS